MALTSDSPSFVHNVYFWMKNPDSIEEAARLASGIKTLATVTGVQGFHLGRPAPTDREVIDNTYTFHLMLQFDTLEAQSAYQVDPIHEKFVEHCSRLWEKVVVYDSDASLL